MDLSQLSQLIGRLGELQAAADALARAVKSKPMDEKGLAEHRSSWAAIKTLFEELDAVLGEQDPDEDEEKDKDRDEGDKTELSAETARRLRRMDLDLKHCGITSESELLEMRENDATARKALKELKAENVTVDFKGVTNAEQARARIAVAHAKAKGVAAARSRFGK